MLKIFKISGSVLFWGLPLFATVVCVPLAFSFPRGDIWTWIATCLFFVGWPALLLCWLIIWWNKKLSILREVYYLFFLYVFVFILMGLAFWLVGGILGFTREYKQRWSENGYVGFVFLFIILFVTIFRIWKRKSLRQGQDTQE